MTTKLQNYIDKIQGKRFAILGLGISNVALVRFLRKAGAGAIDVYDKNDNQYVQDSAYVLFKEKIIDTLTTGQDYLTKMADETYDFVAKSPIIRPDDPEIVRAVSKGAILTSEMGIFMECCPCQITAITGSDGKTTTTTLTYKLLEKHFTNDSNVKTYLGGNIGTPLVDMLWDMSETDRVVLELSSFQLMALDISASASVITNITPNHLDVHKSYQEYIDAKKRVYSFNKDAYVVLNGVNDKTKEIAQDLIKSGRRVAVFSAHSNLSEFAGKASVVATLSEEEIIFTASDERKMCIPRKIMILPGLHNIENLMAAVLVDWDYITEDDVREIAGTFGGVEHRLEFVRELDGVRYYNSSIDSSPNRTINALSVFDGNIVLIAGGKDKGIPYDAIGPVIRDKVRVLILTGPTRVKIEEALEKAGGRDKVVVIECSNYAETVSAARANARRGDVVLLSPASTSFDMFHNFEERGNVFKDLVRKL